MSSIKIFILAAIAAVVMRFICKAMGNSMTWEEREKTVFTNVFPVRVYAVTTIFVLCALVAIAALVVTVINA